MLRKIALAIICCLGCLIAVAHSQDDKSVEGQPADVSSCGKCHVCRNPTTLSPCLVDCPREAMGGEPGHSLGVEQGPAEVVMDELENLYEPVIFNHKVHAGMADMCEGCQCCHHYSPTDTFHPPCKECHDPEVAHEHVRQPGLKGAYHRQCMGCHRNWSQETECEVCHAMKSEKKKKGEAYVAATYRPCSEPMKKTYETVYDQGKYVTFFHNNHAHEYGLKCNDCHRDDSCVRCHYQGEQPVAVVEAETDLMHHKCSACHDIKTQAECVSCHSAVKREAFDHGLATGLALDENHIENECSDCHADFKKPDCSDCHEDEMNYPDDLPGTLLKSASSAKK